MQSLEVASSSLMSIDPGKGVCGWAKFQDSNGRLLACGLVRGKTFGDMSFEIKRTLGNTYVDRLVVEKPQVYQQRMWKGDPNDLIDVAIVGGMAAQAIDFGIFEDVTPRKWKGTRPKKVCNKLTLDTLDDGELEVYRSIDVFASLRHNVLDAIGIGLWRLGRR